MQRSASSRIQVTSPGSRRLPRPGRQWLWLPLLLLLLAPFVLPIPLSLERMRILRAIGNQLHVFLLLAVTLVLYRRGPWAGRLLAAACVAAFLGGLVDLVQEVGGRHPRLRDFGLDVLGVTLAVCWIRWRQSRSRLVLGLGALLALIVPAQLHYLPFWVLARQQGSERFPLLGDFESSLEGRLWGETYDGQRELVDTGSRSGRVLRLTGGPPSLYPGVEMRGFPRDWRGYRILEGEVRARGADDDSVSFVVRIDDFAGHREGLWAARRITVGPGWQRFALDLSSLTTNLRTRSLQLNDIYALLIYLPAPVDTTIIELDNLRLRAEGAARSSAQRIGPGRT